MIDYGTLPTTVNRKISTLKSFYNYLIKLRLVTENPARLVRSVKKPHKLPLYYKEDQIDEYLDKFSEDLEFSELRDTHLKNNRNQVYPCDRCPVDA